MRCAKNGGDLTANSLDKPFYVHKQRETVLDMDLFSVSAEK